MGDHGPPTPPVDAPSLHPLVGSVPGFQEEVNVLVTGFGPFKTFSINPSHLITSTLPSSLAPLPSNPKLPKINLIIYPNPIRVSYPVIRSLVPSLVTAPNIDFVLHIGMAAGRNFYTVETRGHRGVYKLRDVDGNNMENDPLWRETYHSPEVLYSDFDAGGDVYRRWRKQMEVTDKDADIRISEDAGRYLCDFTYYTSLVEYWKDERERKVLFLHVPGDIDEEGVERGRKVAVGLIRAMVESWISTRNVKSGA